MVNPAFVEFVGNLSLIERIIVGNVENVHWRWITIAHTSEIVLAF